MRTFSLIVALLLLVSLEAPAQDYQRRYAFAQSYVGLEYQQIPADGSVVEFAGSDPIRTSFPRTGQVRLVIGGLHFWQHAEFYVDVPLVGALGQSEREYSYQFSGTATGARFLPFGIEEQSIRPYLGLGWNVKNVTQEPEDGADAPTIQEHFLYFEGGLNWTTRLGMFELGGTFYPRRTVDYYPARHTAAAFELPRWAVRAGYKFPLDVTARGHAAQEGERIGRSRRALRQAGLLSTWSVGVGYGAALLTSPVEYNRRYRPYLDPAFQMASFPDLSIGHYWYRPDVAVRLSWRPMVFEQSGWGTHQRFVNQRVGLEAMKFVFDYHGFVPFLGLGMDRYWLHVTEMDRGDTVTDVRSRGWMPSLVFGWDIRPTDVESVILRTNLRYAFAPDLELDGAAFGTGHLEINFIQVVIYPGRLLHRL